MSDATDRFAPAQRHQFHSRGQLVYEWDQSLEEVNLYIKLPPAITAKKLDIKMKPTHLTVGIKGNTPYLDRPLENACKPDQSIWDVDDGLLTITLQKAIAGKSWVCALEGHEDSNPLNVEADQKRILLERFQREHPGFDFSGANFSGACPDPETFLQGVKQL